MVLVFISSGLNYFLSALCMEQLLAHWLLISESSGLGLHALQPGAQVLVGVLKLSRKTHYLIQFLQNIVTHRGDLSVFCFYSIEFALDDNHLITYEHKVNSFRVLRISAQDYSCRYSCRNWRQNVRATHQIFKTNGKKLHYPSMKALTCEKHIYLHPLLTIILVMPFLF